jgi:curved DNA-binding protein CbpA
VTGPLGDAGPFSALGLPARADLTDDEVRSAWRRVAAATHPDRADGGDPGRFAAAAAAYTTLRTRSGRGEALDRPRVRGGRGRAAVAVRTASRPIAGRAALAGARFLSRIRRGRPARLALRILIAATVSAIAVAVAGAQPATPALITGALTWLLRTARHDLAPPS